MAVAILVWKWRWPVAAWCSACSPSPTSPSSSPTRSRSPTAAGCRCGGGLHLLHHHDLAARPPHGCRRDQRRHPAAAPVPRAHGARARPRRRHRGVPDRRRQPHAGRLPAQPQAQQGAARAHHHAAGRDHGRAARAEAQPGRGRAAGQGLPHRDRPLRLHRAARRARCAARLPAARHRLRRDGDQLLPRPRDPGARASIPSSANGAATGSSRSPIRPRPPRPSSASRRTALSNWATRSRSKHSAPMPRTTLVLLPGLLNTRRVFEQQIEALSDIADCIVPELWHHDTMGAMAEAALALAPPTFALGGFSMGGYVAFEILRRAPERVERLALIDTQATPDFAEVDQAPPCPARSDQDRPLPWRAAHAAAAARASPPYRRCRGQPADLRHGPGDRRRGLRARAARHHRPRRQPAACWSTSTSRPW